MSRSPFSSGRDTPQKRRCREEAQRSCPVQQSGYFLCETESETGPVALPYKAVRAKPSIFRPTECCPNRTYYMDSVCQDLEYTILVIDNHPRIPGFQPELRSILRPDRISINPLCRTASNLPLDSHPELKKQLLALVGRGAVFVNLTPLSMHSVVVVVGVTCIHVDGLPIVVPVGAREASDLIEDMSHDHTRYNDLNDPVCPPTPNMHHTMKRKRTDAEDDDPDIVLAIVVDEVTDPITNRWSRLHALPKKSRRYKNSETRKAKRRKCVGMNSVHGNCKV